LGGAIDGIFPILEFTGATAIHFCFDPPSRAAPSADFGVPFGETLGGAAIEDINNVVNDDGRSLIGGDSLFGLELSNPLPELVDFFLAIAKIPASKKELFNTDGGSGAAAGSPMAPGTVLVATFGGVAELIMLSGGPAVSFFGGFDLPLKDVKLTELLVEVDPNGPMLGRRNGVQGSDFGVSTDSGGDPKAIDGGVPTLEAGVETVGRNVREELIRVGVWLGNAIEVTRIDD